MPSGVRTSFTMRPSEHATAGKAVQQRFLSLLRAAGSCWYVGVRPEIIHRGKARRLGWLRENRCQAFAKERSPLLLASCLPDEVLSNFNKSIGQAAHCGVALNDIIDQAAL